MQVGRVAEDQVKFIFGPAEAPKEKLEEVQLGKAFVKKHFDLVGSYSTDAGEMVMDSEIRITLISKEIFQNILHWIEGSGLSISEENVDAMSEAARLYNVKKTNSSNDSVITLEQKINEVMKKWPLIVLETRYSLSKGEVYAKELAARFRKDYEKYKNIDSVKKKVFSTLSLQVKKFYFSLICEDLLDFRSFNGVAPLNPKTLVDSCIHSKSPFSSEHSKEEERIVQSLALLLSEKKDLTLFIQVAREKLTNKTEYRAFWSLLIFAYIRCIQTANHYHDSPPIEWNSKDRVATSYLLQMGKHLSALASECVDHPEGFIETLEKIQNKLLFELERKESGLLRPNIRKITTSLRDYHLQCVNYSLKTMMRKVTNIFFNVIMFGTALTVKFHTAKWFLISCVVLLPSTAAGPFCTVSAINLYSSSIIQAFDFTSVLKIGGTIGLGIWIYGGFVLEVERSYIYRRFDDHAPLPFVIGKVASYFVSTYAGRVERKNDLNLPRTSEKIKEIIESAC